jgi:hypothetical protein
MSERDWSKDEAVCNAAAPGPWISCDGTDKFDYHQGVSNRRPDGKLCSLFHPNFNFDDYVDNANFVAESREGWPAALVDRKRLDAENAALRQQVADKDSEIKQLKVALESQTHCGYCGKETEFVSECDICHGKLCNACIFRDKHSCEDDAP